MYVRKFVWEYVPGGVSERMRGERRSEGNIEYVPYTAISISRGRDSHANTRTLYVLGETQLWNAPGDCSQGLIT